MLHYVLCVSRFAHYVKVIARDRVGSHSTAEQLQSMLSDWVHQYVTSPTASNEAKRRQPLSDASVEITDVVGRPGVFGCVMHIQPHFQIDQVVAGFRLYTEIEGLRIS
jgi:type VI secretion system protein ImpD